MAEMIQETTPPIIAQAAIVVSKYQAALPIAESALDWFTFERPSARVITEVQAALNRENNSVQFCHLGNNNDLSLSPRNGT